MESLHKWNVSDGSGEMFKGLMYQNHNSEFKKVVVRVIQIMSKDHCNHYNFFQKVVFKKVD